MTNWYKSEAMERPQEIDATSSPSTVYQRKDIKEVQKEGMTEGESVTAYEYLERQMTKEEYAAMNAEMESPATKMIMQSLSAIEMRQEMLEAMMM